MYRINPLADENFRMKQIVRFFMYEAPGINSKTAAPSLSEESQKEVWNKLLNEIKIDTKDAIVCSRRKFKLPPEESKNAFFNKPFLYCQKGDKETEFESLLRHLRNALAHGNLFIKEMKRDTQVCLLDFDKHNNPTAKIVTNKATLKRWMNCIVSQQRK